MKSIPDGARVRMLAPEPTPSMFWVDKPPHGATRDPHLADLFANVPPPGFCEFDEEHAGVPRGACVISGRGRRGTYVNARELIGHELRAWTPLARVILRVLGARFRARANARAARPIYGEPRTAWLSRAVHESLARSAQ